MLSGKNRFTALEHLLRSADATAVLVDNTYATLGQDLANAIPDLKLLKMDADAWPGLEPYERPAYCGESTDAEKDKPALYLHTSGSTGINFHSTLRSCVLILPQVCPSSSLYLTDLH